NHRLQRYAFLTWAPPPWPVWLSRYRRIWRMHIAAGCALAVIGATAAAVAAAQPGTSSSALRAKADASGSSLLGLAISVTAVARYASCIATCTRERTRAAGPTVSLPRQRPLPTRSRG